MAAQNSPQPQAVHQPPRRSAPQRVASVVGAYARMVLAILLSVELVAVGASIAYVCARAAIWAASSILKALGVSGG